MRKYKRDSELKRERMKEWERMKEREWKRGNEKENDWDKMKNIKFEDKGHPLKIKNFILRWNLMIIQ